jgi:EpsI family protein
MMNRYLLVLVAGSVLLTDGYVCGRWTGRWHGKQELAAAAARLDALPLTIGDWQGTSMAYSARTVEQAGFSGYIQRRYENRRGVVVNLLVACGPPGPLSVHTPEVCYAGSGFKMSGDTSRYTPNDGEGIAALKLWKATFIRSDPTAPEHLRVLWGWHQKGAWTAPDNPRWKFAGTPVLYKMYITQAFLPRDEATDADNCIAFLRELLPELEKVIEPER